VQLVQKEKQVLLVQLALKETQVSPDQPGQLVQLAPQEPLVQQVELATLEQQDHRVTLASPVQQVEQEILVLLDHRVTQETQVL